MIVHAPLPQTADAVSIEYLVRGYDGQVARLGLGDEHTVEGVAMQAGESPGARRVVHGDRQITSTTDPPAPLRSTSR